MAKILLLLVCSLFVSVATEAQCMNAANGCAQTVPHLVKFSGTLKNISGAPPVVAIRFVIYGDATGGTPLWQEVQNAQIDQQGHYDVMLGATASEGVPVSLFATGETRWLGVQALLPGQEELPRVLLVSVPYALQAENAETLGGWPASAFAKAGAASAVVSSAPPETVAGTSVAVPATGVIANATSGAAVTITGATVNTISKFSSSSSLTDSQITDQNGIVSMANLSNILFADRFTGGVSAAIAACPANGCIIYATSPNVNLNLGNIDPGYKAITIYLGPYTYTVNQIMLRKALKIIGMGAMGGISGTTATCSPAAPCNGTSLQSINGNNPVFVIPQTNNEPATDILLSGFRLYGSAGNTSEDGFFLDTSSTVNAGLWHSTLDDIYLQGFAGVGIHIKGRASDFAAASQWLLFNNVVVFRNSGGGNALRLEGSVFELRFRNCEFDGQAMGDGTNIYMGGYPGAGGGFPTTIAFEGLVSQQAAVAVQIDGAVNIIFYNSHHEVLSGAYLVTSQNNMADLGLTISDSYFAGNVGINGGSGYLLKVATTNASGVVFAHNHIFGAPDSVVASTNFASVVYQDNLSYNGGTRVPPTSGLSTQMSPAATINTQGVHTVGLNPSTTPITTIQSGLGPGETITFFSLGGSVTFGTGGNIDLMGMSSLTLNGSVTFVRTDLGGLEWKPVSQWSPTSSSATTSASLSK
ncbi:MAG: hypothetical protein ACLPZF_26025 [Candidatus Acidiferrales bacterium]